MYLHLIQCNAVVWGRDVGRILANEAKISNYFNGYVMIGLLRNSVDFGFGATAVGHGRAYG
jgi:hypothetical protein